MTVLSGTSRGPGARGWWGRLLDGRRFAKSEDGGATTEFVVIFPIFLVVFLSCFEASLLLIRQLMLERAVDVVVRDVRLSTGTTYRHDQLKSRICDNASILPNCLENLVVELTVVPTPSYAMPDAWSPCVDTTATTQAFSVDTLIAQGAANDPVLVRACYVVRPVFPGVGLGLELVGDDAEGEYRMTAASAFVQEPENDT